MRGALGGHGTKCAFDAPDPGVQSLKETARSAPAATSRSGPRPLCVKMQRLVTVPLSRLR